MGEAGVVCGFAPYQHGHVWREYIGSLQFDLAQTYKVHLSEWNAGGPLGLMAPRPPRQCEVVSPSRNDRVDLENLSSWQGEWSYIPAEAVVEQVTRESRSWEVKGGKDRESHLLITLQYINFSMSPML